MRGRRPGPRWNPQPWVNSSGPDLRYHGLVLAVVGVVLLGSLRSEQACSSAHCPATVWWGRPALSS